MVFGPNWGASVITAALAVYAGTASANPNHAGEHPVRLASAQHRLTASSNQPSLGQNQYSSSGVSWAMTRSAVNEAVRGIVQNLGCEAEGHEDVFNDAVTKAATLIQTLGPEPQTSNRSTSYPSYVRAVLWDFLDNPDACVSTSSGCYQRLRRPLEQLLEIFRTADMKPGSEHSGSVSAYVRSILSSLKAEVRSVSESGKRLPCAGADREDSSTHAAQGSESVASIDAQEARGAEERQVHAQRQSAAQAPLSSHSSSSQSPPREQVSSQAPTTPVRSSGTWGSRASGQYGVWEASHYDLAERIVTRFPALLERDSTALGGLCPAWRNLSEDDRKFVWARAILVSGMAESALKRTPASEGSNPLTRAVGTFQTSLNSRAQGCQWSRDNQVALQQIRTDMAKNIDCMFRFFESRARKGKTIYGKKGEVAIHHSILMTDRLFYKKFVPLFDHLVPECKNTLRSDPAMKKVVYRQNGRDYQTYMPAVNGIVIAQFSRYPATDVPIRKPD